MKIIKLYEQWIQEESQDSGKPYTIEVTPNEGSPFQIEASSKSDLNTNQMMVFTVSSSTNPSIKANSTLLMSPRADKQGEFDLVSTPDPNDPSTAITISGKTKVTDKVLTAKAAVTG